MYDSISKSIIASVIDVSEHEGEEEEEDVAAQHDDAYGLKGTFELVAADQNLFAGSPCDLGESDGQ